MEAALAGGGPAAYADSVESSPRSLRNGESWDETYQPGSTPAKLRLMCSYGGHIVPRPHDKTLCYLGGETRIVVVDRHTTLPDLTSKLSRSLLSGRPFSLKYQLPSEDLDSLISITTDEDLDNMIEEYDRISSGSGAGALKPSRIRLFLFPIKSDSTSSSISSLLDDSKSETWFVDALNGVVAAGNGGVLPRGFSADSTGSSINCLLGLDDDAVAGPPPPPAAAAEQERTTSPEKTAAGKATVQDVHSVSDSLMLDTTSSFGSASSALILSNLPPIRVRVDDRPSLEEHFSQMNLLGQMQEDGVKDGAFVVVQQIQSPQAAAFVNSASAAVAPAATSTTPVISPSEDPNRASKALSSDDEKLEQAGIRNLPQLQHPPPQAAVAPPPSVFDLPIPQRIYYPDRNSPGLAGLSIESDGNIGKQEATQNTTQESNYRVQMPPPEPSYLIPIQPEKFQHPQQPYHHPQQQYVHANPQLMQHQSPTPGVPYQSFYQMQPQMHPQQQIPQAHAYNQQMPMFFVPIQPNPNYGIPNMADAVGIVPQGKPALPMPSSVLQTPRVVSSTAKPEMVSAASLHRTGSPAVGQVAQPSHSPQLIHLTDQNHQQFVGYHPMQHHPSQSVAAAGYRYEFSNTVPAPQMYYTQATSAPLPSHFQTVSSSVATVISDVPSQLQQVDVKQTRASS